MDRFAQGLMVSRAVIRADLHEAKSDVFKSAAQDIFGNGRTEIATETRQRIFIEISRVAWMQNRDLLHHVHSFLTPTRQPVWQSSLSNW